MTQLDRARALIAHIAEHLRADLSVELWNGETLPLGPQARSDIRIRIASPAAIGQLVRSPRLTTLVDVYVAGGLEIIGASPLDALGRWEHLDAVHLKRNVDKMFVLRNALPFLTARPVDDARCLIPDFDGASLAQAWKDALWDRFYMGAPGRQRQSVERYSIVKRA